MTSSDAAAPPAGVQLPPVPGGVPRGPRAPIVALLIALGGVLFAWNAWRRDFWGPEETMAAGIAREMASGGGWIVPRFAGGPHLDLPPLGYWLAAGARAATGLAPELSYRLPAVLAAVASLALTYVAGRKLFDGRIGFLAAAIQASTWLFFRRAAWLDDDLLFAVSVQLALTSFALASRKGAGAGWGLAGWAGLAGAALSKSALLALGLVVPTLLLFLFLEGGVDRVCQGFRRARPVPGVALLVLLAAPWYAAAAWREPAALLESHVVSQHLRRLFGSPLDAQPPYYYLLVLLGGFLPWTLFLPLGLLHGKDRMARGGERLAFLWVIVMGLALTFVSAKKPGYLLVVWPPLCLLVAAAFFETREVFSIWEELLRDGVCAGLPALLRAPALVVLGAAALHFTGRSEGLLDARLAAALADRREALSALALAAAVAALLYWVSYRVRRLVRARESPRAAFELACAALFLFFAASYAHGPLNALLSGRPAVGTAAAAMGAGAPLAVYGAKRPEVYYYLGPERAPRHLDYPDPLDSEGPAFRELKAFLEEPRDVYLIASRKELETLELQFPSLLPRLREKASARLGLEEELVLVGNR
ncbi:MAG: glycosyltransferase family 39 protein [Planctomycetes bacterium]|nr:glycosyltransferase family 39 protein [Planctomycetota bacterium]